MQLFKNFPDVKIHGTMNLIILKTPVGSNEFVAAEIEKKLEALKSKVDSISKMPFKMEAFNLLNVCLSRCRVIKGNLTSFFYGFSETSTVNWRFHDFFKDFEIETKGGFIETKGIG